MITRKEIEKVVRAAIARDSENLRVVLGWDRLPPDQVERLIYLAASAATEALVIELEVDIRASRLHAEADAILKALGDD